MDDKQKATARAIVNIFETGHVAGDYGSVTVLKGDSGHLTYGRSQTTLGSGNLYLLIKAYCDLPGAQFAKELGAYLPRLMARDVTLDNDASLRDLLREAGHEDPKMGEEQDRFFDRNYLEPALRTAVAQKIMTPLGQTVVYDSFIQGGFWKVVPLVGNRIGDGGVDEETWVSRYIEARRGWLKTLASPLPKTVYRMDAFDSLVTDKKWMLDLNLKVRGYEISLDTLGGATVPIRATAADPRDPAPGRILQLTTPYMKGEDVRRVQEALATNGLVNQPDGIFGPYCDVLVRKFQEAKGMRADGVVGPSTRAMLGL